ncbi:hypothetical protein Syun_008987 [Stephania yunnanensis]|uniref:Uncharacterized protein n=1 Tax=Stephania yunnanensis TaxID=152371 RepID=A0AAP0KFC2_9MAGN
MDRRGGAAPVVHREVTAGPARLRTVAASIGDASREGRTAAARLRGETTQRLTETTTTSGDADSRGARGGGDCAAIG